MDGLSGRVPKYTQLVAEHGLALGKLRLGWFDELLAEIDAEVADTAATHAAANALDTVVVSHQDPIHAGVRMLTMTGLADFNSDKPAHATVVSLERVGDGWRQVGRFSPEQGDRFPPQST